MTDPVETLARALWAKTITYDTPEWDDLHGSIRNEWRQESRALLAQITPALVAQEREAFRQIADSLEQTHKEVLAMKAVNAQWSAENIYRAFGHAIGGLVVAKMLALAAIHENDD